MRARIGTLLLTGLMLCALGSGCEEEQSPSEPQPLVGRDCLLRHGKVSSVIDGDTVRLEVSCSDDAPCGEGQCEDGRCSPDVEVRLMGINTGEISHGRASDPQECLGEDARLALERLTLGREVELIFEPLAECREKYQRMLAYVWVDGLLVQERLVQEGLACLYWYTNDSHSEETLYYTPLAHAEERARRLELGLWSVDEAACGGLPFPESRCRR